MPTTKSPTMRDVAKLAGVSVQTVSCVVNSTGSISEQTRKRVCDAITQLHYRRDPIARSMRTRQSRLFGLLVLDITNPVLSIIASAVEAAALADHYRVVLYNVGEQIGRQREYLAASADALTDGLIIVNAIDHAETLGFLEKEGIPAVLIDSISSTHFPSVSVDNVRAAYLATEHAIRLGHQRIAHIAGPTSLLMAQQRQTGYEQALRDFGLNYCRVVEASSSPWSFQAGYEAMQKLLQEGPQPTTVFASSDEMAIGVYRAITEAGLCIPHDVSVIGFDGIDVSAYVVPALTTIRQPYAEIAANAVSLLLRLIAGEAPETTQIVLPPELVVRQSTARIV